MRIPTTKGLHPVTQFTVRTSDGEEVSEASYTEDRKENKGLRPVFIFADYVTFAAAAGCLTMDGRCAAMGWKR